MRKLFIMTIRNEFMNSQMKLTVENGRCYVRQFLLYPYSDIMTSEKVVTQKKFIKIVTSNMSDNLTGEAVSNVYFNGYNYRKFMNMGNYLW